TTCAYRARMRRGVYILCASAAAYACAASHAHAFEAQGSLDFVSDYRWRGLSMSHERAAATLAVEASWQSGVWVSSSLGTISEDYGGEEVTLSAGVSANFAGADWSLGAAAYAYPDADDLDYQQALASAAYPVGPVTFSAGIEYAPEQDNLDGDDTYAWLRGEWGPNEQLTLHAQWGVNDGAMAIVERAEDIDIGAAYAIGPALISLSYVDAETVPSAVVASVRLAYAP
ncbi:MAG: TorF family putative porin, partial [Caulobacterales bacterium]